MCLECLRVSKTVEPMLEMSLIIQFKPIAFSTADIEKIRREVKRQIIESSMQPPPKITAKRVDNPKVNSFLKIALCSCKVQRKKQLL